MSNNKSQRGARKIFRYIRWIVLVTIVLWLVNFCNRSFPIITGYAAKAMCSEIFLAGRNKVDVEKQDLSFFPISIASCVIDKEDSSVTASILGGWKQKAVFRNGIGSTLLHGINEDSFKKQADSFYRWQPINADSIAWPMGDSLAISIPPSINKEKLDIAVNDFFNEDPKASLKNTRALVIVYDRTIVAERYAKGFNKNSMLLGWSMGKSIASAMMGILHKQGMVQVDEPAGLFLWKQNATDDRNSITIKNILQQSTGLQFEEVYTKRSDVTTMLYLQNDMANFAAAHVLEKKPGTYFQYSSGNANLLSLLMRERLGEKRYHSFPYLALFNKLGMQHTLLEKDASGTFITSSYVYASARDWARFGLLYLNKGMYNSEQLLDSAWIDKSFLPAKTDNFNRYGYQWWLNRGNDSAGVFRMYPHAPADMVYAGGFQGQNVFIIPSKKLVVVRLGLTEKADYRADHSLQLLLKAMP
ncbi:MAG: serine hydrolase [Chitinophagaceae bacterium]